MTCQKITSRMEGGVLYDVIFVFFSRIDKARHTAKRSFLIYALVP